MDKVERIAMICHEANRAYCASLGDFSHAPWERSPEWVKQSARAGVELHLSGEHGPEASHQAWMEHKLQDGWVYGPVKDADLKQHPCLVPFHELPAGQQLKDVLFRNIVHAFKGGL